MTINIVRFRPRRSRVAVAYSTKDRTAFTQQTIKRLLDHPGIDLYWFDGSATEAGRALPHELCAGRAAPCELHSGVVGGPDCAIMYALETLQSYQYDLTILLENDVLLQDGWFEALHTSIQCGLKAGFQVGGASVRVLQERVLSFNDDYCLLLNSGAGCMALTRPAIDIVLANYRTVDSRELFDRYYSLTGLRFSPPGTLEDWCPMSADWLFDLILYLHGYVVTAPALNHVHMLDNHQGTFVADANHSGQERHRWVTRPSQLRTHPYPFFRFQKSPLSDRLLVSCHHLQVSVGLDDPAVPVRADKTWRREWLQGVGPFALAGTGQVVIKLHGARIGLFLVGGATEAEVQISTAEGSVLSSSIIAANALGEIMIESPTAPIQDVVMRVVAGRVRMVGITAPATLLSYYANARPSFDHLPG